MNHGIVRRGVHVGPDHRNQDAGEQWNGILLAKVQELAERRGRCVAMLMFVALMSVLLGVVCSWYAMGGRKN